MAKYYGMIGYAVSEEVRPGVYKEHIVERPYTGDVTRTIRRLENSSFSANDDLTVNNEFSIVADPFAFENFHAIRYATYLGSKWKITAAEVRYPRLILSVGGVYNADDIESTT